MKLESQRIIPGTEFFILLVLLFLQSTTTAQTTSTELNTATNPGEDIIVREDRSTSSLRNELRQLDLEIYRLLNSLIRDEYYNINCNFPPRTQSFIRKRLCDTGYGELASQYASDEASVMEVFDQLPAELLQESGLMMTTELEQGDKDYREIVFALANEHSNLADKLLRRHYLQLVLNHRRENWWNNVFGREVQPLAIPATELQLPKQ